MAETSALGPVCSHEVVSLQVKPRSLVRYIGEDLSEGALLVHVKDMLVGL